MDWRTPIDRHVDNLVVSGRLAGKRAIVTGGGQGIGRATVELFMAEGAEVLALDIAADALDDLRRACGCATRIVDITDTAAVTALARDAGAVDVLFLCAGYVATGTILDSDPEQWDRAFAVNVTAMYHLIRAVLPSMLVQGSGSIITMSSVASSVRGVPERCVYAASKAAVIGLTKAVAADYIASGIRCNVICPGTIDTPALDTRLRDTADYAAARAAVAARQPLGRMGTATEIARLALYLASDESSFTTGQCHIIDGGWAN